MTDADLRTAIEATLGSVPYTPPLSVAYTEAVKDDLAKRTPGATLDVYFTPSRFQVEARLGDARSIYSLNLRP